MTPKDKEGNSIHDLAAARVDKDESTPGIQELKDWETLFEYMDTFEDQNNNGIKEIPERYSHPEGRLVSSPSLNPIKLLKRGSILTWAAFFVVLVVIGIVLLMIYVLVKKIKNKKSRL